MPAETMGLIHPSPREGQVIYCVATGLTYGQTASRMGISIHTVHTYIRRIFEKYQISGKTEITHLAIQLGLLRLGV